MHGKIYLYLAEDHLRLEDALRRATERDDAINLHAYAEFRAGLLRHIGIEEKILLPSAQKARGGKPLPPAAKLRSDHGALAALFVPTPTASIINTVRAVLTGHNPIEERPGGVYEQCEELAGSDAEEILLNIQSFPAVKVAPYADTPIAMESLRTSLRKAGYGLKP